MTLRTEYSFSFVIMRAITLVEDSQFQVVIIISHNSHWSYAKYDWTHFYNKESVMSFGDDFESSDWAKPLPNSYNPLLGSYKYKPWKMMTKHSFNFLEYSVEYYLFWKNIKVKHTKVLSGQSLLGTINVLWSG